MFNAAEFYRQLSNVVRFGLIHDVQVSPPRVRVQSGIHLSDWLPWLTDRAASTSTWNPPVAGEQVVLLCPTGELDQAIVLGALFSNANPEPQDTLDTYHTVFPDGTSTTYDHVAHVLTIEINGDVKLTVNGDLTATVNGKLNATITGNATVDIGGTASIIADGKTTIDAPNIHLNGGAGVVTGAHICHYTGSPHGDCSSTVTAEK